MGGHGLYQDNLAGSPWIDLAAAGVAGTPGKFVEFDTYFELPLLNYIFIQTKVKWFPYLCPVTGLPSRVPWSSSGNIIYFFQPSIHCTIPGDAPYREQFGAQIDADAERVRIALGVFNYCRFYANCPGESNSTPWFDNVRFGVFGAPRAPVIVAPTVNQALDAFPAGEHAEPRRPRPPGQQQREGAALPGARLGPG